MVWSNDKQSWCKYSYFRVFDYSSDQTFYNLLVYCISILDPGILDLNYYHMTNSQLESQLEALPKDYQCTVLLLNNNKLTYLPDLTQYAQFNKLQVLNINYNKLTEIREKHIPHTVHTVYLNYNEMTYLSPRLLSLSGENKLDNKLFYLIIFIVYPFRRPWCVFLFWVKYWYIFAPQWPCFPTKMTLNICFW